MRFRVYAAFFFLLAGSMSLMVCRPIEKEWIAFHFVHSLEAHQRWSLSVGASMSVDKVREHARSASFLMNPGLRSLTTWWCACAQSGIHRKEMLTQCTAWQRPNHGPISTFLFFVLWWHGPWFGAFTLCLFLFATALHCHVFFYLLGSVR